jgi:tetratricopeptide (TPR) repeat protein
MSRKRSQKRTPAPPPLEAADLSSDDGAAALFFAEAAPATVPPNAFDSEPPRELPARPLGDPARRAYLRRYVVGAVALAGAICVAASVRVAVARVHSLLPERTATAAPPRPADVAPAWTASTPVARTEVQPSAVPTDSAAPVASVASGGTAATEGTAASEGPADAAPEPDPLAARAAKKDSQRALDRGNAARAVEAGERSVALDPSDGEAWLILGAAYEQRGAYAEARRCFSRCVHTATRGPRGECAALLR